MADIPYRAKNEPFFAISITPGMTLVKRAFRGESKTYRVKRGRSCDPCVNTWKDNITALSGKGRKKPAQYVPGICGQAFLAG
jgi:hypothetical protein